MDSTVGKVKVTVSLPKELFDRAEAEAATLQVSRSRLFADAIASYLYRQENHRITEQLDAVYNGEPDLEEKEILEMGRRAYVRISEREAKEEGAWMENWGAPKR